MSSSALQLSLEASLEGHTDWVTQVTPSPAGNNQIITASRDKTLICWQLDTDSTGQLQYSIKKRLIGHSHFVSDVAVSNDGKYAISSSWDKTLRLWDVDLGESMKTFVGHRKDVLSVCFSLDNRQIISGSRDGSVKVWNTIGQCKMDFSGFDRCGHRDWVSSVRFIPKSDDLMVVSGSWDRKVKVWDLYDARNETDHVGHTGYVNTVCVSPDGSLCASGGKDGNAMLWDLNDEKHLYTLNGNGIINQLTFSPNRYWLCGAVGDTIKVWDLENKQLVDEAKVHTSESKGKAAEVLTLAWMPDGQRLIAGYTDGVVSSFATSGVLLSPNSNQGDQWSAVELLIRASALDHAMKDKRIFSENWRQLQTEIAGSSANSTSRTKKTTSTKKKKNVPNKKQQKQFAAKVAEAKGSATVVDPSDIFKNGKKQLLGIDCEYVGAGPDAKIDVLARVSVVDEEGICVYDKYVAPTQQITDYRTEVSGIRASDLVNAVPFDTVRSEINEIIDGNIVVGHALHNDFRVLQLNHPKNKTRDTAKYRLIQKKCGLPGRSPSLKLIAQKLLGLSIQSGEHSSVEDAKVAMAAYRMFKNPWEQMVKQKYRD
ncbi:hypothetical protein QR680_010835 [Steinernema hermaphroditum]|uniref:RNA exonuclease 4 n=1 Tax=Steinernema hermaphroditum TaxID=289476 RepID=A0AA39MBB8_9BILA|nr:hypothetical protein QR680_010835 [Steinernema hermaphroditum]